MLRHRMLSVITALLFTFLASWAQDVIVLTDGSTILSKVLEVTPTEVKYKKHTNLNGPTYTALISTINCINYQNGEKETFNAATVPARTNQTPTTPVSNPTGLTPQPGTQGYEGNTERYYASPDTKSTQAKMSDYDLMKNYQMEANMTKALKKAKRLKVTAWIGGLAFFGAGTALTFILPKHKCGDYGVDDNGDWYFNPCKDSPNFLFMGAGALAGIGWWTGFQLAAKNQQKKAYQYMTNAPVFETEVFSDSNRTLSASIDAINATDLGHRSMGLGLGLRYTF